MEGYGDGRILSITFIEKYGVGKNMQPFLSPQREEGGGCTQAAGGVYGRLAQEHNASPVHAPETEPCKKPAPWVILMACNLDVG
jgi:hypothetical protein